MTMIPWTPELFQASQTEANSCRELTKIVLRAEEPDDDGDDDDDDDDDHHRGGRR